MQILKEIVEKVTEIKGGDAGITHELIEILLVQELLREQLAVLLEHKEKISQKIGIPSQVWT